MAGLSGQLSELADGEPVNGWGGPVLRCRGRLGGLVRSAGQGGQGGAQLMDPGPQHQAGGVDGHQHGGGTTSGGGHGLPPAGGIGPGDAGRGCGCGCGVHDGIRLNRGGGAGGGLAAAGPGPCCRLPVWVRSVAGAGRCRWAWLHRQRHHRPAVVTVAAIREESGQLAAADSLRHSGSSRSIKIYEWPIRRVHCPQLSPIRLPCWRLLTLARLVVVAAAIGVALVLLVLTSARDWPCSPGRADCHAAQVVGCHRRAAPAGITSGLPRQLLAGQAKGPPGGGAAAPCVGDPTTSHNPKTGLVRASFAEVRDHRRCCHDQPQECLGAGTAAAGTGAERGPGSAHAPARSKLPGVRLCHVIHDEILLEAPEALAQAAADLLLEVMKDPGSQACYLRDVLPLVAEVSVGRTWAETH